MPKYYIYFGTVIFRDSNPLYYALRYTARLDNGQRLSADTLAGIKELIRDSITPTRIKLSAWGHGGQAQ